MAADNKSADSCVLELSRSSMSEGSTLAGPFRDSFEDEVDFPQYVAERSRSTFIGRILRNLGMSPRRRRTQHDGLGSPLDDLQDGVLRKRRSSRPSPHRDVRRCRRSYVGGCLRRTLIALPIAVLCAFGILHVAEYVTGRTGLLWDVDTDEYLPEWGRPGQEGEGLAQYPTDATRDVIPIPCHSHNDYWRRVPLLDALHWGCTGVEADVWLFDEELYVGHNTASLTKNRTFQSLYVNPLVDLLDRMNPSTAFANTTGHGVFDADPDQSLILLVDFKTNGRDTFPFVSNQLSALRDRGYLTHWDGEKVHSRAVTVVGTGNTPFDMVVANETYRDIFFDAPLDRLWERPGGPSSDDSPPTTRARDNHNSGQSSAQGTAGTHNTTLDDFHPGTSFYASVSFTHAVGFVWRGKLSAKQLTTIRGQIRGAHRRGLRVRYWDTPSWPVSLRNHIWQVLMREGADMLNVDDLKSAAVANWRARVHGFW